MSNLTSVGILNGIPNSGTGTVSTLDAVLAVLPTALAAHGGLVVEGVVSGVALPVSGTLAATQSGTWTVQPGNTANTTAWKVDGSAVTQPVSGNLGVTQGSTTSGQSGSLIQGAVTTSAPAYTTAQTSPLSLDTSGNLRVNVVTGSTGTLPSFSTTTSFTCGTTAYAANDVVGVGGGSAALDFGVLGTSAGIVEIMSASLEIDTPTLISGQTTYRIYLYNVTPPSALADSAAWDLPSGDRASFLGFIDLGMINDLGSTLYLRADNYGTRLKLSGTHLFGYLVTNGAYTPTAQVHLITLHTQGY